ncbi:MAG: 2-oxoglutarate dehydrogenase complex dihydrolipoyllysine-residue succinyltransferase [Candidatus Accumulibacter sp.]|uniref:2-oxoglutarate dehydrogenase complex dihydrolipoyllysine-residue succinyltransferase n=1 Tax=Accumulibacter sp. TaxID=2053492 RepID=UPI001ACFE519|nr:2-oxoglutarate dehydrogenase complex dihydrolipoyllysine-residue succinyltransferase [Accumulibacter sp.]MBN8519403.1 2-oxoglutarate dehydrogenase complex dihydrolipoyllysine-residue succinyltransferase [Accumulibacter sp.]MBO3710820.1 2-oxoglutarate dehydrogenase complex dihydrolipoyllysine-residue succinyltransferase [Accumulibacter sp.]MCC2868020.1 2-oxoglutarate dehydrogenase complex dihydrolipoyllysine-residue succinyltransferase [Candidatus Accumulibacter phosphatis]MCM8620932.1 2-oxog
MIIDVKVPQLSESVAEATLVTWHKKAGEAVTRDENLIDIETDKVVLELPAPDGGVLVEIVKTDGETVVAGEVIARIDTAAQAGAVAGAVPATRGIPAKTEAVAMAPVTAAGVALPAARKILEEKGMAASSVAGTGRGGRVTKSDALAAQAQAPVVKAAAAADPVAVPVASPVSGLAPAPSVTVPLGDRPEQRVPMSRLRARVAERLLQSQATNAILTTFNEVNMGPIMALRKQYGDRFEKVHGVRLGFMGFFVKAAVAALQKFPVINASVDGNDIVYHGYIDIGIAVGSPRGLVVPILRDADQMTIADIEKKIGEFGSKAKDGKLSMEDLTGGTFSISNGGVFGSMLSTPIINPPQSAILGIHATKDRPVVENGQVVIRPINYLAMSYDHRIIDGREAVLGLVTMKEALEDPARLLLGV